VASDDAVTPADVAAAAERLRGQVLRTPVERSPALSAQLGGEVWLKLDFLQQTGSFKLRGALNRLLLLGEGAAGRGVVTASAGNHGLGIAEAAARLGISATVVVPETASPAKIRGLAAYGDRGIELVFAGQSYDEAETYGLGLARQMARTFVSGYNDPAVIAGGGTVAVEVLEDVPEADVLVVPVGGGGLIGGVGVWAKQQRPGLHLVGAQPEVSAALAAALAAGKLVEVPVGDTLADGLAGNIEADSITFPLAQRVVDQIALVSEDEIAGAMRWLLREHHVLVEGSAAATVAVLLAGRVPVAQGRRVVVLLTGRNVAYDTLRRVVLDAPAV
jgi:threonine dehydratase